MSDRTALYIHIPFCKSRCHYCAFTVLTGKDEYMEEYLALLDRESLFYERTSIDTVFIGGGTPTRLSNEFLNKLFNTIYKRFNIKKKAEITIEANPASFDYDKACLLKEIGVNRVSLGVQSLKNNRLEYLGRIHDRDKALEAFHILRKARFHNINVDLISSIPNQDIKEFGEDLREVTGLGSEHIAVYSLSLEEGSRFYKRQIDLKDEKLQIDEYHLICDVMTKAGFCQYEISNFAKAGKICQHNMVYWQGGNYIGLGIGAHSHHKGRRSWNTKDLSQYRKCLGDNVKPEEGHEVLSAEERFIEEFLFRLRLNKGVDLEKLQNTYQMKLAKDKMKLIDSYTRRGLLEASHNWLKVTKEGRLLLDYISTELI